MSAKAADRREDRSAPTVAASASGLEADVSVHIFTTSAALVGVCLTVIGLIHVVVSAKAVDTLVDDLLAVDAVFFLVSCLLAYWALRTRSRRRMHRVERVADAIFLLGLGVMTLACAVVTYSIL